MSIASEITRISQNIADSLDVITNKGVVVPSGANSDNLPSLISQIQTSSGLDYLMFDGVREGNTFYSDETIDAPLGSLKIYGKSILSGSSKNNFAYPYYISSDTNNGVTLTINSDGSISLSGTASAALNLVLQTSDSGLGLMMSTMFKSFQGSNLILSGGVNSGIYLQLNDTASSTSVAVDTGSGAEFNSASIANTSWNISLKINNGTNCNGKTVYPMIRVSGASSTWEAYSSASISNFGDSGSVDFTCTGKNLLPLSIQSQTISSVKFTVSPDGTILVNGTRSSSSASTTTLGTVTLPAGNYVLSGGALNNNFYLQVLLPGASAVGETNGRVSFSLTGNTLVTVRMYMRGSSNAPNLVFRPMICESSDTDFTYQPYSYVSTTMPTPNGLFGIQVDPTDSYTHYDDLTDTYWICDEIDFERRVYIKRIGSTTFGAISSDISAGDGFFRANLLMAYVKRALVCTIYGTNTTATSAAGMGNYEIMRNNSPTTFAVTIKDPRYTSSTLDAFKTAISGASVIYALEVPVETPLTPTQVNLFNKLKSCNSRTKLVCSDPVQPDIRVKFLKPAAIGLIDGYERWFYGGVRGTKKYPLEEQFTGSYWVDGRPIYRKTFVFNSGASNNSYISLSDLGMDYACVADSAFNYTISSTDYWNSTYYLSSSDFMRFYIDSTNKRLYLSFGSSCTIKSGAWATLEYTKTVDPVQT